MKNTIRTLELVNAEISSHIDSHGYMGDVFERMQDHVNELINSGNMTFSEFKVESFSHERSDGCTYIVWKGSLPVWLHALTRSPNSNIPICIEERILNSAWKN